MYKSLLATKGKGEVEVLVAIDEDDPTRKDYPKGPTYLVQPKAPASTDLWNKAWAGASGDIAMMGADDIEFQTPGWNSLVEDAFWSDQIGMVYGNDRHPVQGWSAKDIPGWVPGGERVEWRGDWYWRSEEGLVWPTHLFVSRRWIETVGYFTPPYFSPTWEADTWIFLVAQAIGRIKYLEYVHIEHLHPMNHRAPMDETYAKGTWANPKLKALGEKKLRSRPMALEREAQVNRLFAAMLSSGEIPRVIHQFWVGPRPAPEAWMSTWKALNPGFDYKLWTEEEVDAFGLRNRAPYDRLMNLHTPTGYGGASDVVRAEVLEREGGIWVDADSRALKPLDGAPFLREPFFLMEEHSDKQRYLLNGCFMGSVPHHPILLAYIRALSQVKVLRPEWKHVGPGLLTKVAEQIGGATVLAPEMFFTNGQTGGYGEHYWGSTMGLKPFYKGKSYAQSRPASDLSILVAFTERDKGIRTEVWEFLKARWQETFPEAEIVVGEDTSVPFNKPAAYNRAAREAKGSVFLIADSDIWLQPWLVHEARDIIAGDPRKWVKPWNVKRRLDPETSRRVLDMGADWDGAAPARARFENVNTFRRSPPLLMHRDLYEAVNGHDERMAGWGGEDSAFFWSLEALFGHPVSSGGDCIHLWHPRRGKAGRDMWEGQDSPDVNEELYRAYERVAKSPNGMCELISQRRALAPSA